MRAADKGRTRPGKIPEKKRPNVPSFPVVGIGASAGGYEAFRQLLQELRPDSGMAFVLVQHLDPAHESRLTDLLARATSLPIVEARDGMAVQPNHIYVLAPNTRMVLARGRLQVTARPATGRHLPVDTFFRSLAEDLGRQAIGVVLSGTADDGTEGVQAIKAAGGITFAQEEKTARYPGMPHSAAATGCVDFVLAPGDMARELTRIAALPGAKPGAVAEALEGRPLLPLFRMLWARTGVDFSHYKQATVHRRIRRRMALHHVRTLERYLRLVQEQPSEIDALYADLLIHVTGFFRDASVFSALQKKIFPRLCRARPTDTPIRIWVPGCSTGEEAYSLAMGLLEHLGDNPRRIPIQIFATDLSAQALEKARAGLYPASIAAELSPAQLHRFFVREPGGYRVSKAVRALCVFALHDLIKDPPFSNLDLVSCRNVLIYLGPTLQRRILPIFHYALKPDGFLVLGKSETISRFGHLFHVADRRLKIYQPKMNTTRTTFAYPIAQTSPPPAVASRAHAEPATREGDVRKEADRLLVGRFAPASVLVNEDMEVLQFRGRTGPFLEHEPGAANLNLLRMVRDDLAMELRTALNKARRQGVPVRRPGLEVQTYEGKKAVRIEVIPLRAGRGGERHFLVLFEEVGGPPAEAGRAAPARGRPQENVLRLKQELTAARQAQREIVEELETANEDFKAVNEEIQSSNEELQSTNEELETAKEELQSANEELSTVNEELQTSGVELAQLNDDLLNLLASLSVPILLLGPDRRIRRFTPGAVKVLGLLPTDVGRALAALRLDIPHLEQMIADAMSNVRVKPRDVQLRDGRWYTLQVRPYRTSDSRIDGAVIVLWDIDAEKRAMQIVGQARDFAQSIVATARDPLLVLRGDLRVRLANDAFCRQFRIPHADTQALFHPDGGSRPWNQPALRRLLHGVLRKNVALDDFCLEYDFPAIGRRTLLLTARRMGAETPGAPLLLLAIEDITERRQLESGILNAGEAERQRIGRELHDGVGQALPAIGYLVGAVHTELARKGAPEAAELKKIARLVAENAQQVHELARGLFPVQLKRGGIVAALQELAAHTEDIYGIRCRYAGLTATRLASEEVGRQVYRIAQEAVTNAVRHSRGKRIDLRLSRVGDRIAMSVRDTGIGLPARPRKHDGMGLRIMQYRAELIGAALKIDSARGRGTTVTCRFRSTPPREMKT